MRLRVLILTLILSLAFTGVVLAQSGTHGKVSGTVTSNEGDGLPGVTVTASSPSLQGTRVTQTGSSGGYVFPSLSPGEYTLTFELEGFDPVVQQLKVSVQQLTGASIILGLSTTDLGEEIIVTGEISTISQSVAAQSTYEQSLIEKLPTGRTVRDITLLAPGVQESGVAIGGGRGLAISIAGSQTSENLFMVNGVTINENLRGQALDLYIEDAVLETTATISGVSAEYGRFAGGVINAITKSGGNSFSGSLRVNYTNQDWAEPTALTNARDNTVNETYEATFGGRLIRDKVWFFAAGRDLERAGSATLQLTGLTVSQPQTQERLEGKLTITPLPSHSLVASYLDREQEQTNVGFSPVDFTTLNNRADPQELTSANYTGIFGSNFFVEAQYSEREFTIADGAGASTTDRIGGTWFVDLQTFQFIASPVFCAVCVPQKRDNENFFVKGNYFLNTGSSGSHDFVAGYDTFTDIVIVENHQSGSDFSLWGFENFILRGTTVFPAFSNNGANQLWFNPVLNPTQGSFFEQDAVFVNDRWTLNDKWSFNLGVRFDENNAVDSGGGTVSDDNKISPRLGATWDVKGDGDWVVNASFGDYVTGISNSGNTGGAGASAGALATFQWLYNGPSINPDPNAPTDQLISQDDALRIIFDWFASIGDTANTSQLIGVAIPGVSTQVGDNLVSPSSQEFSLGITKRLGSKGLVRADYVKREFNDFYAQRVDTGTGTVTNPDGSLADLVLVVNEDNLLSRQYDGLHTQFAYRVNDKLNVAGNWTWSHARGNWNGETRDQGPIASAIVSYPEYRDFANYEPRGSLAVDVRHKISLWAVWELLQTERHNLSLGLLQNYASGRPFGAQGNVASTNFVDNSALGYLFPPPTVQYFYTGRDAFKTDDITRTDFTVNYAFQVPFFGRQFEIFLQPEVVNLFDEDGVQRADVTVLDATNSGLAAFNPFTEIPVEGIHYDLGPNFGQAINEDDFQQPRTFRFSVGFRF